MPDPEVCTAAKETTRRAVDFLLAQARPDGHFIGELRCNALVTAEYVFLYQSIGLSLVDCADALRLLLASGQRNDGSWGQTPTAPGDISITCECYLALKILGLSIDDPIMVRAQEYMYLNGRRPTCLSCPLNFPVETALQKH